MTARDMVLTRLYHSMAFYINVLTQLRGFILWQDTSNRHLPGGIRSALGDDPKTTLYTNQLQHYMDRIFKTAEAISIHMQFEMANIGTLLNDVDSVSTGDLYKAKERVDFLSEILLKMLMICNDKGKYPRSIICTNKLVILQRSYILYCRTYGNPYPRPNGNYWSFAQQCSFFDDQKIVY